MSPFSKRSAHDLEENALTSALRARRAKGKVVDLTVSNPTTADLSPPPLSETGRLALAAPGCAVYEPLPFGLPEARAAIA
ncbi:MAG: pyridoxal phosphate-dependent aminotransferase, partial [Myxococcales bacterium]|nr:pyridoxal phosphate-dependent aminotransferase [Myxococcales bacterium]